MRRLGAGRAKDGTGAKRVEAHHHPTAETHLAVRQRFEHCLELIVMQRVNVVEHYEGADVDFFAPPVDANALDRVERRVGGSRVLR